VTPIIEAGYEKPLTCKENLSELPEELLATEVS
jgi:hypothetical protein